MAEAGRLCVICQRRPAERPQACDPCRHNVARDLADIPRLHAQLPDHLAPGQCAGQRVSGSREAPLPLRVDVLDLGMPARVPNPTPAARQHPEDQADSPSAASVLWSWCTDIRATRDRGEVGPEPTVAAMCRWLADRADWACDEHPAVDEFAAEVRDLRFALLRAVGSGEARPELCSGVPCRRCDLLSLWRLADGSGDVECHNPECRTIYRPDEYHTWTMMVAASVRPRKAS